MKWANRLSEEKSTWKFAHNFNTENILNEIKGKELSIWSPYFSKSTVDLVNEIKKIGFNKINLIPDISQSQKIRIIPAELEKLIIDDSIQIQIDTNSNKEKQAFFHAKVWLSENKIAIGSWNCSYRALGINTPYDQKNIEAGIIEAINAKQRASLLFNLKTIVANTISGTEEAEMDNEWKDSLNAYSMCCDIIANWETFDYEMVVNENYNKYTVVLPHNPNIRYPINKINGLSFIDGFNRVLKNKLFTVYNIREEIVFIGYLNEIGKLKRPTDGYVSFYDLFESLTINPLLGTNKARVKYQFEEEDINGTEKEELPFFAYSGYESYYLMFVALQKLLDTISENGKDKLKLEDLGYRLPSSLINIKSLFSTSFQKLLEDKKEDDILFHYFMAMEINECIKLFNRFSDNKLDEILLVQFVKLLKLDTKDLKFIIKAMTVK